MIRSKSVLCLIGLGYLGLLNLSHAGDFEGEIRFKGVVKDDVFVGDGIRIEKKVDGFSLDLGESGEFEIAAERSSFRDVVFDLNSGSIAILLGSSERGSRSMELIVRDGEGETERFRFKAYEMTEHLAWIVELGDVSENGTILAKCAKLKKLEDTREVVLHKWVMLVIDDRSLKVSEDDKVLRKWGQLPHE